MAITQAQLDSEKAVQAGNALAARLVALGYKVGPSPAKSK
jgi:hypothetical protein